MPTVPTGRTARKPFFRPTLDHAEGVSRACLSVLQGKRSFLYWLSLEPSDWGTAFRLEKFRFQEGGDREETEYHVLLSADGNHCTCKGHVAHGHCKHVRAVLELQATGQLYPIPTSPERKSA